MAVPRKFRFTECHQCKLICKDETIKLTHTFRGMPRQKSVLVFCSQVCMMDYFEMRERVVDRVEAQVAKELKELHKRVCPACVRRFAELT